MAIKQVVRNLVERRRGLKKVLSRGNRPPEDILQLKAEIDEISHFIDRYRSGEDLKVEGVLAELAMRRTQLAEPGHINAIDFISKQIKKEGSELKFNILNQSQSKEPIFRMRRSLDEFHQKEFGRGAKLYENRFHLSKNQIIIMMVILIFVNILVRIPSFPHEYGRDSFYIHYLAQDILNKGYGEWVIHPASLIGVYPYSYPAFVYYFLAYFSTLTGIGLELVILLVSIFLGVLGALFTYIFARQVTMSALTAFFSAFAFSLSPIFIKFSMWTTSTRALFMVFMPLLLYFLVKFERTKSFKHLFLALFMIVIQATIHRMFVFIIAFLIPAYFAAWFFFVIKDRVSLHFSRQMYVYMIFIMILLFALQFSNIGFFQEQQYDYTTGYFFDKSEAGNFDPGATNKLVILANLAIDYSSRMGFLSVFFIIGLFIYLSKLKNQNFDFIELFLIFFLTAGIILFIKGKYINMFYLVIFALVMGVGLEKTLSYFSYRTRLLSRITPGLLIIVLTLSMVFTLFMFQHWLKVGVVEMTDTELLPWKPERVESAYRHLSVDGKKIQISEAPLNYYFFANDPGIELLPTKIDYSKVKVRLNFDLSSKTPLYYEMVNRDEVEIGFGLNSRWGLIVADPKDYRLQGVIDSVDLGYIYRNKLNPVYDEWSFFGYLPDYYNRVYDNSIEEAWALY